MKRCPFCGKELPEEMSFCPYCMNKLDSVTEVSPTPVRKKSKKPLIVALAFVVCLIGAGAVLRGILSQTGTVDTPPSQTTSTAPSPTPENISQASSTDTDNVDYSSYIGVWQSSDDIAANLEEQKEGFTSLEIITIKNGVIRFNLTKTSDAPQQRIAILSNITAEIIDNVVSFSFEDDGWGNSGTGKMTLSPEEIYVVTRLLESNPMAMWNISGCFYLTRRNDSVHDLDMNYLLMDFSEARNNFGEESREQEVNLYDASQSHFYQELTVDVNPDNNLIVRFSVDYSAADNKKRYQFRGVDGNSTLEDIISCMGQPVLNLVNETGEVGYGIQNGFIKFSLDDNLNVTGFYAFLSGE